MAEQDAAYGESLRIDQEKTKLFEVCYQGGEVHDNYGKPDFLLVVAE